MIIEFVIIILGLVLFEVISSIDNAVINAKVLTTVSPRARAWFLTWGLFVSVFLVRGLLPLVIVFASNPSLGILGTFTAAFSSDPQVTDAIENSKASLLAGGAIYLVLLFVHWLLRENDSFAWKIERSLRRTRGYWYYGVAVLIVSGVLFAARDAGPSVTTAILIGTFAFVVTSLLKANAARHEAEATSSRKGDFSKLLYLELIDATFSIDGVLGAFAFTTAVPLILIGNGIGAIVVRQVTIKGIGVIATLPYLTNGAMYSVALLGSVMLVESHHIEVPFYVTPLFTAIIVGYFGYRSWRAAKSRTPCLNARSNVV